MTKLIEAVKNNNLPAIDQLLKTEFRLPGLINQCDSNGWAALHHAAHNNFAQAAAMLIKAEANLNQLLPRGTVFSPFGGATPLLVAAKMGHDQVVKILINARAEIDKPNRLDNTPLLEAAAQGHGVIVQRLINAGAKTNQCGRNGATPFRKAVQCGQDVIVQFFIRLGVSIEQQPELRKNPLLVDSADEGHNVVTQLLINAGADVNEFLSLTRNSPLLSAAGKGHNKTVLLLLGAGADVNHSGISKFGKTPLSAAALHGHELTVKILLAYGADVNCKNDSALKAAKRSKHKAIANLIKQFKHTPKACQQQWRLEFDEQAKKLKANIDAKIQKVMKSVNQIQQATQEKAEVLVLNQQLTSSASSATVNHAQTRSPTMQSATDVGRTALLNAGVRQRFTNTDRALVRLPPAPVDINSQMKDMLSLPSPPTDMPIRRRSASPRHLRVPSAPPTSTTESRVSADGKKMQRSPQPQQYQRASIQPPKIEEVTQLACAIESHRPTTALRPTNKAMAQQQLQQDYTAFTSQQTALASLEAEIARLKLAGVDVNTVRINELQAQHDVVAEQVGILFNQFMREQARIQAIEAFSSDPRLADFYSALQNLLGNVVIGYKAAASGVMQIQSSEVGGHFESAAEASTSDIAASAFKSGAKKLGKVLGKNADKIISTASQGITLLGHSFEFLPGVGALLKGAGKVAGMVAEKRAMNRCIQLSEQITMPIFLGASQQLAFQLTQQFKAQLLSLPLPSDEKSSVAASAGQKLFKSGAQSSVRKLAEYATMMILESFHEHHVPDNALSEEAWVQHWLDIIHKPRQPSQGPVQQCLGKLGVNSMIATTQHKARWNLTQLFAETGIQVPGAVVLYYARTQNGAQLYGFRAGTQSEAKRYQMVIVSGPHQSASTTRASSASVKHVAQQVSAARQQMGALELQAKQMRMQAKRGNSNRLANEVATLKMAHESLFQDNSVELQQQGTKLIFMFRQPNLREDFAESLSYLDLTTDCRLLAPSQVELTVKTTFLANKLQAQLLQQGMSESDAATPVTQHSY